MNDSPLRWARLAALSPLLAVAASFDTAAALTIGVFGTLIGTTGIEPILRRYVPANQRPLALALVAALVATALDLLLQAFCYRVAQPLHGWLPLLAVLPVLFDQAGTGVRAALSQASVVVAGLLLGAALRRWLPLEAGIAACLLASGLALALIERLAPSTPLDVDDDTKTARTRARVTGPLR